MARQEVVKEEQVGGVNVEDKRKVVFSDLSSPLKVAVIAAYGVAVVWLLLFLAGFLVGIAGSV